MAIPFTSYRPFDTGPGASVTESGWRAMAKHWLTSGPIRTGNNLEVYGDSSGRQVKVKTGEVWIQGHHGQLDALTVVPITANTSGLGRIDLVVARMNATTNVIELDVVLGIPSGAPVAPSPTQSSTVWEVPLATVVVANGVSTIAAGAVFDARRFAGPWDTAWTAATLQNSWVNYGSGYETAAYRRVGDMVQLRGLIKNGSLNVPLMTLPVGFRPPQKLLCIVKDSGTVPSRVDVDPSGTVVPGSEANNGFLSLAQISFSITP